MYKQNFVVDISLACIVYMSDWHLCHFLSESIAQILHIIKYNFRKIKFVNHKLLNTRFCEFSVLLSLSLSLFFARLLFLS